jgi:hypothetical protein
MKKAFTRTEMLVVVLVLSVPFAYLVRAQISLDLAAERAAARRAACKSNLHSIGIALRCFRTDHEEQWPSFYMPNRMDDQNVNAWGRFYGSAYLDDVDCLACPSSPKPIVLKKAHCGLGSPEGEMTSLLNSGYGYDNGRIPPNCDPARALAADLREHQWLPGAKPGGEDAPDLLPPNHADGCNVVFVDVAVKWIEPEEPHKYWIPYQGWARRHPDAKGTKFYEQGLYGFKDDVAFPVAGKKHDFVRRGRFQNPRLNEDAKPNLPAGMTATPPEVADYDDIYAIEADTACQWGMLSEWQFRTSWLVLDAENRENEDPKSGARKVPLSKIDAAIQPQDNYRAGTGWPDTAFKTGEQTPKTPREKWTAVPAAQ